MMSIHFLSTYSYFVCIDGRTLKGVTDYFISIDLSDRHCHVVPCLFEIRPKSLIPLQADWETYAHTLSCKQTRPWNHNGHQMSHSEKKFQPYRSSNPGPLDCRSDSLPTELCGRYCHISLFIKIRPESLFSPGRLRDLCTFSFYFSYILITGHTLSLHQLFLYITYYRDWEIWTHDKTRLYNCRVRQCWAMSAL